MRRAAALAIALVVVLLLLLRARSGQERSARGHPARPAEIDEPGTAAAPETAAADLVANTQAEAVEAEPGTIASGHVTDADGKPLAGLRLLAIPRDNVALWDAEDPCTPPGQDPAVPFAHTDPDGAFAFRGLPPGHYRFAIDESTWMLDQPFFSRADASGLRVVASRARSLEIRAWDLATQERIGSFSVCYRWPRDAEERVGHGTNGLFRARMPTNVPEYIPCNVEAEGYHGAFALMSTHALETWLVRALEPRLVLRVAFEDGSPCEADADVVLRQKYGSAALRVVRTGDGHYLVAVPAGSWTLDFRPNDQLLFRERCTTTVEMEERGGHEVFLRMERGGDLVVGRKHWDGKPWKLLVEKDGKVDDIWVTTATFESRYVAPGKYIISVPPTANTASPWQREIEVTTGSRHELTIE